MFSFNIGKAQWYFRKIRKLCVWDASRIDCISAGFNHSALITAAGELYTWGKNLEMQLGHGNKKDRAQPSLVIEPRGVIWSYVQCGSPYIFYIFCRI